MTALTDQEKALVARSVAALRGHGWPAGRALMLVAERLPEGPARDELIGLCFALERGDPMPPTSDPLARMLAMGDGAGQEALLEAVRGYEMRERAVRATRGVVTVGVALLVVAALVAAAGTLLASAMERMFADFGSALPVPTEVALALGRAGKFLAPVFLMLAALLAWRRGWIERLPGVRGFMGAAALRLYAALLRAGVADEEALALVDPARPAAFHSSRIMALDRHEQLFARRLAEREGAAHAARLLADEREAAAHGAWVLFLGLAPVAGVVMIAVLVGPLLIGLYLPILSIAGSIR